MSAGKRSIGRGTRTFHGPWTRDINRGYRFGRAIQAGRVWTDCYHAYPPHASGVVMVERVLATPATLALIDKLKVANGPLMFHQSGGCCDGSAPMCCLAGEFRAGASDVKLGAIGGWEFFMGQSQFEYWRHTQLIIDLVSGRGFGFSLKAPEGVHFLTRSRVFTNDEIGALSAMDG